MGTVVSNKMRKSVLVAVDRHSHNKLYNRYVKRTGKFMGRDETILCNGGDRGHYEGWPPPAMTMTAKVGSL